MSFSNEMVNTHGKKLLRPVRSCSMERAPRHYSTIMMIVKRIWLPQIVSIIVSFGSNLNNLLLSNFHPTIPEIAFHFSLFYSTVLRGKGNFISNSCLSTWPRNSCKYWVMCLISQATIFVTVLDSKPSQECNTTSLSCCSPHFQAQMPLQALLLQTLRQHQASISSSVCHGVGYHWVRKEIIQWEDLGFLLVCALAPSVLGVSEWERPNIVSFIVKIHLIFLCDVVSSSQLACQKHPRELLTQAEKGTTLQGILPGWWIQKGIGHRVIMSYYKAFMPYKAKHILDRVDGREVIFAPVFSPACSHRRLPGMSAWPNGLTQLSGLFGKSRGEARALAILTTLLLGILVW